MTTEERDLAHTWASLLTALEAARRAALGLGTRLRGLPNGAAALDLNPRDVAQARTAAKGSVWGLEMMYAQLEGMAPYLVTGYRQ